MSHVPLSNFPGETVKYEVEFWPHIIFTTDVCTASPEPEKDALLQVIAEHGWPGGEEHMAHGINFKAWVRKVE